MNENVKKTTCNEFMSVITRPFSIFVLIICIIIIVQVQANSLLFPISSHSMFLLITSLVILTTTLTLNFNNKQHIYFALLLCLVGVIFIVWQQLIGAPHKHITSMLMSIWAQLFFASRPVALGLTIVASIGFLFQSLNKHSELQNVSHLTCLLAGTTYLAGEISGSYWGFIGWGKSWSWAGHFYISAITFLLFMAVLHFPKRWFASSRSLAMAKAISLALISLFILGYKLI